MRTSVEKEGFEGILFPGDGSKEKVLIVMSGSNGGMKLTANEAKFYHAHGIPALALALFKTKDTPKDLVSVPVEYVERAVAWLKTKGYEKIGILGMSKGSEMALLAASMFEDISCCIACVPSHFVSEGLKKEGKSKGPSGTSCWSYQGKDIPYAPYKSRYFNLPKMLMEEKELHIIRFNRDKDVTPQTLIPVEKIKGPVLFLSSKHDEVWPSYESATYMEERLTEVGFPYKHKHVAFEYMSHAMITRIPFIYKMAFKSERQHPKECEADRVLLRKELLEWVNKIW
jgi:dienelactone hydrolase